MALSQNSKVQLFLGLLSFAGLLYGLHVNQASNTKTSEKNVMAHGDTIDALRYYDHEELLTIVKGIAIDIDSLKHKH